MAAYLMTLIYGNENFGGYISFDGEEAIAVEHDMTYPIEPGPHHIDIYSTSNSQRRAGAFQAALYRNTSSSGVILDEIQRRSAIQGLGDTWSIDVFVEEDQLLTLSIRSNGNQLVGAPMYHVEDLSEETLQYFEEVFAEQEAAYEAEQIRIANTPRRSPKKIVWGAILMGMGSLCGLSSLSELSSGDPTSVAVPFVFAGAVIGGVILFISGMRKKIR